jgi:oligopeptide/dipeptide ABC transporter ATP-binding protein
VPAVHDIHFSVRPGEILGLVGESGCGKSITALSILRLLSPPGQIVAGEVLFEGKNLVTATEKEMQQVRGRKISMIFQEPMTSLNPVLKVGDQIGETLQIHQNFSKKQARSAAIDLLKAVKIPDPEKRVDDYPHQTLQSEFQLSILLITHSFGIVAQIADRVIVMYAGKIVEEATVHELFENPRHPYTIGLLNSIPRLDVNREKSKYLKSIEGAVPDLSLLPSGCSFYDRCNLKTDVCTTTFPPEIWLNPEHRVACYAVKNDDL